MPEFWLTHEVLLFNLLAPPPLLLLLLVLLLFVGLLLIELELELELGEFSLLLLWLLLAESLVAGGVVPEEALCCQVPIWC